MDQEKRCSICLLNFTSTGKNRIVSLKCGHLFGEECIRFWLKSKKSNSCPKCNKPSKTSDLRRIFATYITASNSKEIEILPNELNNEKNHGVFLEEENQKLNTIIS